MNNNKKPFYPSNRALRFGVLPKDEAIKQETDKSKKSEENKGEHEEKQHKDGHQDNNHHHVREAIVEEKDKFGPHHKTNEDKRKSLDFLFDKSTKEIEKKTQLTPYYEDGNPEFTQYIPHLVLIASKTILKYFGFLRIRYTKENLEKRHALKSDPDVKKAIWKFMNIYNWNSVNQLHIEQYLTVQTALAELLRVDLNEEVKGDELRFILEQDWNHDSKGKNFLTREDLFDSLFELVDIWVPDIDKDEQILNIIIHAILYILSTGTLNSFCSSANSQIEKIHIQLSMSTTGYQDLYNVM